MKLPYRLKYAPLLLAGLLMACGNIDGGEVDDGMDGEDATADLFANGNGLPNFLSPFAPSGYYTWASQELVNKNNESLTIYNIVRGLNETQLPMFERATTMLIVTRSDNNDVLSVSDGISSWSTSWSCDNSTCTATVTADHAADFSTSSEVFSVGQGPKSVSFSYVEGTRSRTSAQQDSDACVYNQSMLDYAADHLNQWVGNGECWTLADDALRAAGAHVAAGYYLGSTVATNSLAGARPGDMLQIDRVQSSQGWSLGAPQHTSIIKDVNGTTVTVYEQNIPTGGATKVSNYDFATITSGTYYVFRAAPTFADKDQRCD